LNGATGASGLSGFSGLNGSAGASGLSGYSGSGISGYSGAAGGVSAGYTETDYVTATSGWIPIDYSQGNVQSIGPLTANITLGMPAVSATSGAKSLTLMLTGHSTSGFTVGISGSLTGSGATDMSGSGFSGNLFTPSAAKRVLVVATSINGSNWLCSQVWKEA
jgi:hypothetical protein